MAYDKDTIFNRLGVFVRWYNETEAQRLRIAGQTGDLATEVREDFGDSGATVDDQESIQRILEILNEQRDSLDAEKARIRAEVEQFITDDLATMLNSPVRTVEAVIEDLVAEMEGVSHTVQENDVSNAISNITVHKSEGGDYTTAQAKADVDAPDQMARPDSNFRAICTSAGRAGEETWALYSSVLGNAPAEAVTGEDFEWPTAGITKLSITPAYVEAEDTNNKLSGYDIEGAVRGVNTDEDGKLEVDISTATSAATSDDEFDQLSEMSLSNVEFGVDTDTDGKIHVSVVADPASCVATPGATAELTDVMLAGVSAANHDNGRLYAIVNLNSTTYSVDLYSDSSRSTRVAYGSGTEDTVELQEDNSSGLSGQATVTWSGKDNTPDETIEVLVPRYQVRLYSTATRGEGDLRAEGFTYIASSGSITFTAANGSSITGSVTLAYAQDDEDITYLVPGLYLISFYSDDDREVLVARAAVTDAGGSDVDIFEVNGSGLSGTLDVAASPAEDHDITLTLGYSVGDYFKFSTTSDDAGVFQTFFREVLGQALPADDSPEVGDYKAHNAAYVVSYTTTGPAPDCRGDYVYAGTLNGEACYKRVPGTCPGVAARDQDVYWIWWDSGNSAWRITLVKDDYNWGYWAKTGDITGDYVNAVDYTGTPKVEAAD